MNEHYSGDNSKDFWDRINKLTDRYEELYSLGVLLQELEGRVLCQLEGAEVQVEIDKERNTDWCVWTREEDGIYETSCGDRQRFYRGTPKDNNCKYCHYCSKKIKEHE